MKTYILYHANCNDGFTAAFVAWNFFTKYSPAISVEYIPVSHGKPIPELEQGSIIYILDFSYPKEIILELQKTNTVYVLDHHKTALELLNVPNCTIDMNRSGARISFDYFFNVNQGAFENKDKMDLCSLKELEINDLLKFCNYIQDSDLWKHELPFTKEINSYIHTIEKTFDNYEQLVFALAVDEAEIIKIGSKLLESMESNVKTIAKNAYFHDFGSVKVAFCNSPIYESRLGNYLVEENRDTAFSVIYHEIKIEGIPKIKISLRSLGDNDISNVAKHFGGGGHKNASGIPPWKFPNIQKFIQSLGKIDDLKDLLSN